MPLCTSRRLLAVTLLAASSFAPEARAQLPVVAPESDVEPAAVPAVPAVPVAPAPAAVPVQAPPPAAAQPPVAVPSPASPLTLAPARAEVIAVGQHSYDDDDDDDDPSLAPRRVWYGWQTLIVDGASLSAVLLGAALDQGSTSDGAPFAVVGLLGYELGPGIVHFVHRNPGRGFASFGVRLAMPLTGAFLGASVSSNCDGYQCESDGAAAGLLLGMAGAIAIDAAVFAYDDRRPRATRARPRLMPLASLVPGRAWVGLGGEL